MKYRSFFITILAMLVSISEAQSQSEDSRRMCDYDGVGCYDSALQILKADTVPGVMDLGSMTSQQKQPVQEQIEQLEMVQGVAKDAASHLKPRGKNIGTGQPVK